MFEIVSQIVRKGGVIDRHDVFEQADTSAAKRIAVDTHDLLLWLTSTNGSLDDKVCLMRCAGPHAHAICHVSSRKTMMQDSSASCSIGGDAIPRETMHDPQARCLRSTMSILQCCSDCPLNDTKQCFGQVVCSFAV
eukprot:6458437-Amphidinium_carterae.1